MGFDNHAAGLVAPDCPLKKLKPLYHGHRSPAGASVARCAGIAGFSSAFETSSRCSSRLTYAPKEVPLGDSPLGDETIRCCCEKFGWDFARTDPPILAPMQLTSVKVCLIYP